MSNKINVQIITGENGIRVALNTDNGEIITCAFLGLRKEPRKIVLQDAIRKLNDEQISFLCDEFETSAEIIHSAEEEDIYELLDTVFTIEICEVCDANAGGVEISDRGRIATEIVTIIGNALSDVEKTDKSE